MWTKEEAVAMGKRGGAALKLRNEIRRQASALMPALRINPKASYRDQLRTRIRLQIDLLSRQIEAELAKPKANADRLPKLQLVLSKYSDLEASFDLPLRTSPSTDRPSVSRPRPINGLNPSVSDLSVQGMTRQVKQPATVPGASEASEKGGEQCGPPPSLKAEAENDISCTHNLRREDNETQDEESGPTAEDYRSDL